MAIEKVDLPGNQYEIKATGKDIPALTGMLAKHGRESFEKSYWKSKEHGFEKISDPAGNMTWVKGNEVESYRAQGYGKIVNPAFVVPELPWQRQSTPRPGKRKYKFNPKTQEMQEVG